MRIPRLDQRLGGTALALLFLFLAVAGCPRTPEAGSDAAASDLAASGGDSAPLPPDQALASDGAVASSTSFFITSEGASGNLGGLAGADARCQRLAEAAGVKGRSWRAYLSLEGTGGQPTVNARDRIGKGPWYNARGVKVADSVDGLHDPDLNSLMNNLRDLTGLDERGNVVPGRVVGRDGGAANEHDILTGSDAQGRLAKDSTCMDAMGMKVDCTCAGWSSDKAGKARVGHYDRQGGGMAPTSWNSAHETVGCSLMEFISTGGSGRFYCFAAN